MSFEYIWWLPELRVSVEKRGGGSCGTCVCLNTIGSFGKCLSVCLCVSVDVHVYVGIYGVCSCVVCLRVRMYVLLLLLLLLGGGRGGRGC